MKQPGFANFLVVLLIVILSAFLYFYWHDGLIGIWNWVRNPSTGPNPLDLVMNGLTSVSSGIANMLTGLWRSR